MMNSHETLSKSEKLETLSTFRIFVDAFKGRNKLSDLLWNRKLFEGLIKNNKLTQEDLRYLLNDIDNTSELDRLHDNTPLLQYIIDNTSFQELIDKFKSIKNKDKDNEPCLHYLLQNKELFEGLIENNKLTLEDLKYLLNKTDHWRELELLSNFSNTFLLQYIIDNISFQELIDKFKSIKDQRNDPCLDQLLLNKELFKNLIENNKLNIEDLRYLLNTIDKYRELRALGNNIQLIKYILNEFLLNKEIVDRFKSLLEKADDCYKFNNIHNIFEYIEYYIKYDEEILKLNELNRKFYQYRILNFDFDKDQKLELIETLRNNEIAQNRLKEIVDNNLELNYDFDQLIQYLKKQEKKNILNI